MEMSNMAYLNETSSVKTIVPGSEVSGFCDVVARQKINEVSGEVPQLSAGEGIGISTVYGKTVITNNISAGQNISLVYDQETNTYRIDAASQDINAYTLTGSDGINVTTDHVNRQTIVSYTGPMGDTEVNNVVHSYSANGTWLTAHQSLTNYYQKTDTSSKNELNTRFNDIYNKTETSSKTELNTKFNNIYNKTETSSKQEISNALQYVSSNAGHTYTGVAPIQVNNTTNEISITGESISAGPGIDIFSSGGYVVISSNAGNTFPITGTNGTTAYTHGADCSSFYLSNTVGRAGSVVTFSNNALNFASYPSTDVSASWYNIINGANYRSNCYCIRFTDDMTAASLEDYSAYDKVTVVHSNQYKPNCVLHWNGYTKTFTSGLYCEMVKGTNDQNQTDWFFTNSGRINNLEWDN